MSNDTEKIILTMLDRLEQKVDDYGRETAEVKGTLSQVLEQVKKTNGTVIRHESRITDLETAAARSDGAKGIKKSIGSHVWDVAKLCLAAFIGWLMSVIRG
jgi:hypothetical protein